MADDGVQFVTCSAVLADVEACRRRSALTVLKGALAARGVRSLLVGRHVLTLRAAAPFEPSGPTNPELHVLCASGREVITTDGSVYLLGPGEELSADDPAAAAAWLASWVSVDRT